MSNLNTTMKPSIKNKMIEIKKEPYLFGLAVLVLISLGLFAVYPIYNILKNIFIGESGLDFETVKKLLSSPNLLQTIWNSLRLGIMSAIVSTIIGFVFAYSVTRTRMKGKKFFNLIAIFPIVSPPFVLALSMILLFGRSGMITKDLLGIQGADVYGLTSLIFIQSLSLFPIAYLNLKGLLESMDASLEDSAFTLGASRGRVFRTITLPLAIPGVLTSLLLTFIKSIEDFGNPMVIGGDYSTLATEAYLTIVGTNDLRTGSLLAVSMLFPCLTAYLIQRYWLSKKSYVTVTGKVSQSSLIIKEKKVTVPLFIFCLLITGTIVLFYGTIVMGAFVKLWGVNYAFTFDNFRQIFDLGFTSIRDTIIIAVIATPITVIFGMLIAFITEKKNLPGKRLIEIGSIIIFAVPGTVVGVGYILSFNQPPFAFTGTATIIVLAIVLKYMSLGIEAGKNALIQIDSSLQEASKILGANGFTTFWKITVPLIKPALFSSAIYAFARAMTSISAIIFLVSAQWNLMTVSILSAVESGKLGVAAAYVIILFVIILLAFSILNLLIKQNERSV